jgi:pantoate--beta-alanine ligase
MKTITYISELQENLNAARKNKKRIGLIPTMGALHDGHLSLIGAAMHDNDYLVVTIFVNPSQFNNKKDLEKYPRTLDSDLEMLRPYPVDLVFAPDEAEMYPNDAKRVFDLSPLDSVMEGKHRPGHFAGVAEIVSKLFEITKADSAYFGQKDFQQLSIIRKLERIMELDMQIIGCPIIREKNGLAMSSRNQLMSEKEKRVAPLIYKTLLEAKKLSSSSSPLEISKFVEKQIANEESMRLEYFEIVDDQELMTVVNWDPEVNNVACIAVHLGEVRLIDNIYFD